MKILAFAASSSRSSINKALVRHAAERLRAELLPRAELELLDLNDLEVPTYSIDRERADGIPAAATRFFEMIGSADALIISFAEHNGAYTAAYKSLYDWASRIDAKVFQGKPLLALSTSPGGRGGKSVLEVATKAAPRFGAELIASLSVPRFHNNFDKERGALREGEHARELTRVLKQFAARLDPRQRTTKLPAPGAPMWNERYSERFASYGTEPNDFVRAVASRIPAGPVLVIAAGEGRDAVYLAERGHEVTAMDLSRVGLENAAKLATKRGVALTTVVADLADYELGDARWAGIVAIWAHVPPALRRAVFAASVTALRPGGVLILESYAPAQLTTAGKGGPPVAELLLDAETARRELAGLEIELCQETRRTISEGRYHLGLSATTQVLGVRPA